MRRLRGFLDRMFNDAPDASRRHARLLGVSFVAAVLLVEGFALRDPFEPAPRDHDSCVKRVQTLALARSGFQSQALPYRARYLDPQQWYLPFVKPFILRTRTGVQSIFPTAAAAVDVPTEWLGGLAAIRLLSILALVAAVAAAMKVLRLERDFLAPIVAVFATPLWFYAYFGSSHPVALALAAAAVLLAFDGRRVLLAGLLLGLSATVRDESLALAPGLAIVCAWRGRRIGPVLLLAAGVIIPLAVTGVLDAALYGRPVAAHLQHAMQGTFSAGTPSPGMPVLRGLTWPERLDTVLVFWLDGRSRLHAALVAVLALVAVASWKRTGSYWGAVPLLALVLVDTATDAAAMIEAPRRTPGLLRLAPFVVFALLPDPSPDSAASWRRRAALILSALFVATPLLTTNTDGGKPLGPRLLLSIWPLVVLAAWQGIRGHLSAARSIRASAVLAGAGVLLVAAALYMNVARLMPLYRSADGEALGIARYLAGASEDVIVMGSQYTISPVIAAYPRKSVMLASTVADTRDIAERLGNARIHRFLYVRRSDREDVEPEFPSFTLEKELPFGRWLVQQWTR